ncbi:MAG: hypothetical protein HY064_06735 [Bacteroidetes bacterium]|nr:hypothetical protein [Bacteroidota bacterium]
MKTLKNNLGQRKLKWIAVFLLLMLANAKAALATNAPGKDISNNSFSSLEVILLISGIVFLILVAWFFGSGQSKKNSVDDEHPHIHTRRHFDHPNDPHFRKVRRKTS